jgi:hypothetical protein
MRTLDASGIALSIVCLVHCAAVPLLFSAAPAFASHAGVDSLGVHWALLAAAAPISALGLWLGFRETGVSRDLIAGAVAGVGLMFAGAAGVMPHAAGDALTVCGVAALAVVHFLNWRRRARCARA